jgi:hypothetical protein
MNEALCHGKIIFALILNAKFLILAPSVRFLTVSENLVTFRGLTERLDFESR